MGLDMYLHAKKYVSGWQFRKADGTIDTSRKEALFDQIKDLLGDVPITTGSPHINLKASVAYWRKANAIHKWFVDNVQQGVDECQEVYVGREQLEELRDLCKRILDERDKVVQKALAEEHLPPQAGFFFGSTDIDDWYFDDLKGTVEQLDTVLNSQELKKEGLDGWTFYYQSSW